MSYIINYTLKNVESKIIRYIISNIINYTLKNVESKITRYMISYIVYIYKK